jgi:phospholipid/cholesterol/gamma-HCH transport system substrate-binding protein
MITRIARLQVLVFVVLSGIGVTFVGLRYVGFGERLLGAGYVVHADLATTGGLFAGAPVTYRGVPVGRVAAVTLRGDGVRADLRLDDGTRVPVDTRAVVAQRSAVGEQYLDLRPNADTGPYLAEGDTIPRDRTAMPLPMETLLAGLDALVASVGADSLGIVIDELGRAFEGNEAALARLLDATSELLEAGHRHLPETLALIRDGRTVLATQAESADAIRRWADALATLARAVRDADGDLRRLLTSGPPATAEVTAALRDLDPSIGILLGNLVTVNGIATRRLAGIEQILVVYPLAVAGGFTVVPGDGTAHLGLVVNVNDPAACNYTAGGGSLGSPPPREPARSDVGSRSDCTAAERAGGSGVRGSGAAPRAGGPDGSSGGAGSGGPGSGGPGADGWGSGGPGTGGGAPAAPGTVFVAGFDPATGLVLGPDGAPILFGGTGGQYRLAGDQSWKQLLLAGLAP